MRNKICNCTSHTLTQTRTHLPDPVGYVEHEPPEANAIVTTGGHTRCRALYRGRHVVALAEAVLAVLALALDRIVAGATFRLEPVLVDVYTPSTCGRKINVRQRNINGNQNNVMVPDDQTVESKRIAKDKVMLRRVSGRFGPHRDYSHRVESSKGAPNFR